MPIAIVAGPMHKHKQMLPEQRNIKTELGPPSQSVNAVVCSAFLFQTTDVLLPAFVPSRHVLGRFILLLTTQQPAGDSTASLHPHLLPAMPLSIFL